MQGLGGGAAAGRAPEPGACFAFNLNSLNVSACDARHSLLRITFAELPGLFFKACLLYTSPSPRD
eukprot:2501886-Alexandrium_andersonii.AAC.1